MKASTGERLRSSTLRPFDQDAPSRHSCHDRRVGHDGPHATGPRKPNHRRQDMKKKDGQFTHRRMGSEIGQTSETFQN